MAAPRKAVARAIREQAGDRCETCFVPNGAWVWRTHSSQWRLADEGALRAAFGADVQPPCRIDDGRSISKIVLTVHGKKVLCQKCDSALTHRESRPQRLRAELLTEELR
jgi:hypothetical protein